MFHRWARASVTKLCSIRRYVLELKAGSQLGRYLFGNGLCASTEYIWLDAESNSTKVSLHSPIIGRMRELSKNENQFTFGRREYYRYKII